MEELRIVKSPTTIKGRTLKFGAVYGKIDGIVYVVEKYDLDELRKGVLTFEFYNEKRTIHTKKHGDYTRGGYWQKCISLEKGKYARLVSKVKHYILANKIYLRQPTPYVRNAEIRGAGAPQEKKAQGASGYTYRARAGYALSKATITDYDACRRIRPGVIYTNCPN